MTAEDVKATMKGLMLARHNGDASDPSLRSGTLEFMEHGLAGVPKGFASRRLRMTWLEHCAWTLFDEVRQGGNDDLLPSALAGLRRSIQSLTYDVHRESYALFMFWDIVLAGTPDYLVDRISPRTLNLIHETLTLLLFSSNKQVRVSAQHGLYHLSVLLPGYERELDGGAPCGFGVPAKTR